MAPHKTNAIILKIAPYRESSCILYLLTPDHGLVHGVAKGVRRKKAGVPPLERGFQVETLLYSRPHRELHTLGGMTVLDYYSSIRTDLFKNVVRDIAFEALLKTMSSDASHPEVFSLVADLCGRMDGAPAEECFPSMVWQFLFHFSRLMGVAPNLDTCFSCGSPVRGGDGAFLRLESGGMACRTCGGGGSGAQAAAGTVKGSFLPALVLRSLKNVCAPDAEACRLPASEVRRITRLFARYCQYHFHHASDFKSLAFLDSILPDTAP
jgi:DNA repair protein RecO (recombination protein O)